MLGINQIPSEVTAMPIVKPVMQGDESLTGGRIVITDCLRGLAALAVCIFHFTYCEQEWLGSNHWMGLFAYGKLGVEVFFVISGFVIPFTLYRINYRLSQYGRFLIKRIMRVAPPYLASILITIALGYLLMAVSHSFENRPPVQSVSQLTAHFLYLNSFFNYEWVNPVYWTLALEFQYYLLIGLCFPLLVDTRKHVWLGTCLVLCFLGMIPGAVWVFHWLPLFLLGIATFFFRVNRISRLVYLLSLALLGLLACHVFDITIALAGLVTASIITFVDFSSKWLLQLGAISYSLYLVHYPVGRIVLSTAKHFNSVYPFRWLVVFGTIVFSLFAAWVLYRIIEKPAQAWASRIRYGNA